FFPPLKTTNLHNEITRFQQSFDESFSEAWDRFNDLLRACPHHGFSELHQLDTFYNALNVNDHDSLNSAAGGNFLDKMPSDCLKIIESKSKVRQSRAKAVVAKVNSSSSTPAISIDVAELKDMTQSVSQTDFERYVKANDAVLRNIQSQGQSTQNQCQNIQNQYQTVQNQLANLTDMMSKFMSSNMASSSGSGTLPGNTITNPKEDLKGITTRSGVSYQGPTILTPSKVVKKVSEPVVAPVSAPMSNLKPSIPYPSRRDNKRRREQANEQIKKFYEIFKDMSFEISFKDALILMPKFASILKALIGNKEKLSEMARTSMNEHCLAVILNKLPKKLGDPGKFLIPCEFPGMDECLALADLGASINLMPLSLWKELSLPELTPTCMTLELTDRSVFLQLNELNELRDQAYENSLIYKVKTKKLHDSKIKNHIFNVDGPNFKVNGHRVKHYFGRDIPQRSTLPELTPTCMTLELTDRSVSKPIGIAKDVKVKVGMFHFLADFVVVDFKPDPRVPLILGRCFLKTGRALIDVHKEIELKDLPHRLEYAFLEGDNKLPVIIPKELRSEEKAALIKVLKSHKRVIAWKLSDIQGINSEFCTHKILMEEDYKPAVQHQRRVNPKIHDVIKKEVEKHLDLGLIYPISDSPWVSP
nr:reverse transcriptase domain-containing protein [Tanacetum cinerariifolium]